MYDTCLLDQVLTRQDSQHMYPTYVYSSAGFHPVGAGRALQTPKGRRKEEKGTEREREGERGNMFLVLQYYLIALRLVGYHRLESIAP